MSDPASRAERLDDRADIARIRGGEELYTEDEAIDLDDSPVSMPVEATGTAPRTAAGTDLVTREEFNRLVRQNAELTRELNKLKGQAKKAFQKQASQAKAMRRWAQQYGGAFSQFHSEASRTRDGMGAGLGAITAGVNGYLEGVNWGETPANPSFLGFAKALDTMGQGYSSDPVASQLFALGGTFLRWLAFTDPLNNNGVTPAAAAAINAAAPQFV